MSKMKTPSDRKPPLSVSPNQLRPRRILRSSTSSIQTPSASLTKTQVPNCSLGLQESPLRPEYRSISCELQALAKMVKDEFGNRDLGNIKFAKAFSSNSSTLFERGRFYAEYSAKRNERLKRKKGETGEDKRIVYNLGVTVESGKRRDSKKFDNVRKSVPANFSIGQTENPRYLLRSSKENKKPSLPKNAKSAVFDGDQKIGGRRVHKI